MKALYRRILSFALAFCLLLPLCGCGKKETAAPTPEFAYEAEHKAIPEEVWFAKQPIALTDGGAFLIGTAKAGENVPAGKSAEYEGQYDVFEPRIFLLDESGELSVTDRYIPIVTEEDPAGRENYAVSIALEAAFETDEGFTVVESVNRTWVDEFKDAQCEVVYYLRKLDMQGGELGRTQLMLTEDISYAVGSAILHKSGLLVIHDGDTLYVFGEDGELARVIPVGAYCYYFATLRDGRIVGYGYDTDIGWQERFMKVVDPESGEITSYSMNEPSDINWLFDGGGEHDLYFCSESRLFAWDVSTNSSVELLDWLGCDLDNNYMRLLSADEDHGFRGLMDGSRGEFFSLKRVPYSQVPQREIISFGVMYTDETLKNAVIDFNRKSKDYRIYLQDYSRYNTGTNWNAGADKLKTEMMAGDMPDIIGLTEMPFSQLAARGLLADLYPLLEADPDMDIEDFFPNIIKAFDIGGKLYAIAPGFHIMTVAGSASVVGDTPGWSYADYARALASMPDGCSGYGQVIDRDEMLKLSASFELDSFVDWASGECYFDSPEFVELLKYAKSFGAPSPRRNSDVEYQSEISLIAGGMQMLKIVNFTSPDMSYVDTEAVFGNDVTYIGFPTSTGVGSVMTVMQSFSISESCKNKQAAWSFLRQFLTDDFKLESYCIPTNIHIFEKILAETMVIEYEKDEYGRYKLDAAGQRIPKPRANIYDGISSRPVYCTTQEQADCLRQIIADSERLFIQNDDLLTIILEGAKPFFFGQRRAEDCARIIQARAKIYVGELR